MLEEVDAFEQGLQGLVEFVGRMILGQFVFQAFRRAYSTEVGGGFVARIDLFDRAGIDAPRGDLENPRYAPTQAGSPNPHRCRFSRAHTCRGS